jgi:hypothetical protein
VFGILLWLVLGQELGFVLKLQRKDGLFEDRRAGDQILWKGVMNACSSISTTSYRGMGEEPLQRTLLWALEEEEEEEEEEGEKICPHETWDFWSLRRKRNSLAKQHHPATNSKGRGEVSTKKGRVCMPLI